ncbi:hypothetical protein [Microseira sp. BLCC-F43]|jgi:hypothetical protein|uniref:hypothetical protein n=1 Tax=Microseira sp. BLCC-F43 TaxID=3153602 RepID=UPI0035BAD2A3
MGENTSSLALIEAIASRNGSPIYLDENAIAPFNSLMEKSDRRLLPILLSLRTHSHPMATFEGGVCFCW